MKLTEYAKHPYTLQEMQFFELLPKNGKQISVRELVQARLRRGKWKTKYPGHVVSVVMRNLTNKIKSNREPFVVKRTEQRIGRQELYYWVEPQKTRSSILD